jgi:hypothetical protein
MGLPYFIMSRLEHLKFDALLYPHKTTPKIEIGGINAVALD